MTLVDHDLGLWACHISDEGLFDVLGEVDVALRYGRLEWQQSRWSKPKSK